MATVVNDRDVKLQAESPRVIPVDLPNVYLPTVKALSVTQTAQVFQVDSSASSNPASITFTAVLTQITGTVNWSVTSGTATLSASTGTSVSLTAANLSTASATIQASVTDTDGTVYTFKVNVAKVVNAATTVRTATGYVYYGLSSASAPSAPSASSYNFSTGAFTGLTANWSTTFSAPANPDTNTKWWACRYTISEGTMGGSQTITFSAVFNNVRFDGLVTFTNLSTSGSTSIDGGNIVTGTLAADRITVGTASDARGSIALLGFNNVIQITRSASTVLPAVFVSDTATSSQPTLYANTGTSNSCTGGNYNFRTKATSAITLLIESEGASSGAAKFFNYGGGFPTTSKEFWAAPGAYAAYSPSGKGKYYFPDGAGPFTGFHPGFAKPEVAATFAVGDIVVDDEILYKIDVSNAMGTLKLSSVPREKGVLGVVNEVKDLTIELFGSDEEYHLWWEHAMGDKLVDVNGVGEGLINVCGENGDIEKGDLIVTSSMPGKGMKQDDDIVRAITVAKAREPVTFASKDEVKQIACIYMSG